MGKEKAITIHNVLNSSVLFFILVVGFRAALDLVYIEFLSPIYTKSFLSYALNFEIFQYAISWLAFLLCLLMVKRKLNQFSDYFFLFTVLTYLTPLTSIYGLNSDKPLFPVLVSIFAIYLVFFIATSRKVKVLKIPKVKNGRMFVVVWAWCMVVYLILWYFASGAASNINLDPTKVYDFREINSEIADVGFLAYLNLWVYKFFTIFLIAHYLHKQKYSLVLIVIVIQFFFYAVSAHKMVIFLPFLAIGIWFYFKNTKSLVILPFLYLCVVLISFLIYKIFDYQLVSAMLIRRAFFVPPGLTFEWFNFFSENELVYWSDKVLSIFIEYPYQLSIPKTVGNSLLGPELAANNGYISSGYAHAGLYGVFLYSIILGYIIKVLNYLGKSGVPLWFSLAITIGPLRTIIMDSDLLTSIISHGLLVSLIILVLYRTKDNVSIFYNR